MCVLHPTILPRRAAGAPPERSRAASPGVIRAFRSPWRHGRAWCVLGGGRDRRRPHRAGVCGGTAVVGARRAGDQPVPRGGAGRDCGRVLPRAGGGRHVHGAELAAAAAVRCGRDHRGSHMLVPALAPRVRADVFLGARGDAAGRRHAGPRRVVPAPGVLRLRRRAHRNRHGRFVSRDRDAGRATAVRAAVGVRDHRRSRRGGCGCRLEAGRELHVPGAHPAERVVVVGARPVAGLHRVRGRGRRGAVRGAGRAVLAAAPHRGFGAEQFSRHSCRWGDRFARRHGLPRGRCFVRRDGHPLRHCLPRRRSAASSTYRQPGRCASA